MVNKRVNDMKKLKTFLLFFWNYFVIFKRKVEQRILLIRDGFFVRKHTAPKVLSIDETMEKIIHEKLSVSRFGDGEIKLVAGQPISFQRLEAGLAEKLQKVLSSKKEGFLVCLPDIFEDRQYMTDSAATHWKKHLSRYRKAWYDHTHKDLHYGNAFLSRCYMQLRDKTPAKKYFEKMKKIWDDADILLIEGEKSRLGIGNDLFDNARSIQRILGPVQNAFEKYDEILAAAEQYGKDKLILLALGPTATVMSYELFEKGYRAVDLGHADVEYEWFLQGATTRVPIKNKFVNEAGAGKGVGTLDDDTYQSQIVATIV